MRFLPFVTNESETQTAVGGREPVEEDYDDAFPELPEFYRVF